MSKNVSEKLQSSLKFIAQDPDYWRAIYPAFSISDTPFDKAIMDYPISHEPSALVSQVQSEGYFEAPSVIPQSELDAYIECIETMIKFSFPPRYALVYDEFYHLMMRLNNVIAPILGDGYYLVPDEFDIHYIEPFDAHTGTPPHRDTLKTTWDFRDDMRPTLINVWIALTDVSALDSCIHILPAHLDPYFAQFGHNQLDHSPQSVAKATSMQNIRALPVSAGTVLGWTPHLLHCGSRSSARAAHPRISLAVYFQSRDVPPAHKFTMDMASAKLPLDYRLYLIEKFLEDRKAISTKFQEYQQLWFNTNSK